MYSKKNILVIDDVKSNLRLVEAILKKSHPEYEILLATSGHEGIETAQSQLPEVILLDIFMPEMDGFETCRKLKSDKATTNIPILMVSAGGSITDIRVEGLEAGADAIISKPFNREEFVALVNVMLRIKRAEDKLKMQNQELEIYIRKQIKEFRDVEDRFLQVSGYALEFFWEINPDGLITYISPVIEKILGYKPADIVDRMHTFPFTSFKGRHRRPGGQMDGNGFH